MLYGHAAMASPKEIEVCADFNYPPYSFINVHGHPDGMDIEILEELEKVLHVNFKYDLIEWDSALCNVKSGKSDLITGIIFSEEREEHFDFTIPLHTTSYSVFARKSLKIKDIEDLKGKRIVLLPGDVSINGYIKPMGLFENYSYAKSLPDAIMRVESGLYDYVIAPYSLGMEIINRTCCQNVEVKGPAIMPSMYCIAVQEGNLELLNQLNNGIEALRANGTLQKIQNKWIKYQRAEKDYKKWIVYAITAFGGLLILLGIVITWWWSLKKQVKKKTVTLLQNEKALIRARKEAEYANRMKSDFISHISHEVRTPLNAIIGFTQLLQTNTKPTTEQKNYLKALDSSSKMLVEIINEILDISKIESGRTELEQIPFSLVDMFQHIHELLEMQCQEKGLVFMVDNKTDHDLALVGDPLRLKQILVNLTNNAIKFTSKGHVTVQALEHGRDEDNKKIQIFFSVHDTGAGIKSDEKDKIFQPYNQADAAVTRNFGGTGLGLPICQKLAELMGGTIELDSIYGEGSKFYFSLTFGYQRKEGDCSDDILVEPSYQ